MTNSTVIGNAGEYLVVSQLNALGFHAEVTRNTRNVDVFARDDEQNPGRVIWAQVKTGISYLNYDRAGDVVYNGRPQDLRSYKGSLEPVIMCVVDLDRSICYWQPVDQATVVGSVGGWRLVIPSNQTLTAAGARARLLSLMGSAWNCVDDVSIARALNPWKQIDTWQGGVQVWSRAVRVVGEPRNREVKVPLSNGNVRSDPVAIQVELTDDLGPRFLYEVDNPSFRVQHDDQLFLIYAGQDPNALKRIATINGDTDQRADVQLGELMSAFNIPVSKTGTVICTIMTLCAIAAMILSSTYPILLPFAIALFVGAIVLIWRTFAPFRAFRRRLEGRLDEHVTTIRASRPVDGWRTRKAG